MAICKECGNTYFQKECPFCKKKKDEEIKELNEIEEIKEKQKNIIKKARGLKINFANVGTTNAEYKRKAYKDILENKIKDKNYFYNLEHKHKKGIQGKITKNKIEKKEKTDIKFLIIASLIIILILVILLK